MTSQQSQARRRWSEAERARLAELARSQAPVAEIAAELGRSTSAVYQQLAALRSAGRQAPRLAAPRWTDSEDAELVRAVGEGETAASVARRLGRAPRAPRRHATATSQAPQHRRGAGPRRTTPS